MNQPLIDNSLLAASLLTAFLLVKWNSVRKTAFVPALLLLFAPLVIFLNMWGHTVAVLIVNYRRFAAGAFHYDFHFYGLVFLGVIFIVVSGLNIDRARKFITGDHSQGTTLHWLNAITAASFLPLVFINPIAALPVLASGLSSGVITLSKFRSGRMNVAR